MDTSLDSISTECKKCGCMISYNLDIIENIVNDTYINLCEYHYKYSQDKKKYSYNKQKSIYVLSSYLSKSTTNKNIKKSTSLISLHNENTQSDIMLFGKYKYKTFNYVYNNDKLYCYK